jgi:molecular chaperone Hsp33
MLQRRGQVSFQVMSQGHLGQVYADVTPDGDLRGYVRNPTLVLTQPADAPQSPRQSIAGAVGGGLLSAIRLGSGREYHQSTVDLISGELDLDVENFLNHSDQVPTALVCDVLLDGIEVAHAGGIIVQGMPGAQAEHIAALRPKMRDELAGLLASDGLEPLAIIRHFLPEAEPVDAPSRLRWKCRCSYERATAGLRMVGPEELAKMVDDKEDAEVSCDFCGVAYVVPASQVEQVFLDTITARG